MSSLLQQLCILQSIDQFKLFALHPLHIRLVPGLLTGLSSQFFFKLLPRPVLSLHKVELSLLSCLLLLSLDDVLHVSRTRFLLLALLIVPLSSHLLVSFRLQSNLLLPLGSLHLAGGNGLIDGFLNAFVHLAFHRLIHLLLLLAFFLLLLAHKVALSL